MWVDIKDKIQLWGAICKHPGQRGGWRPESWSKQSVREEKRLFCALPPNPSSFALNFFFSVSHSSNYIFSPQRDHCPPSIFTPVPIFAPNWYQSPIQMSVLSLFVPHPPDTHTRTIIPHLSCLNLFLSLVAFLLTSSLLGFSFFSVLNLAFSATLWDELISSLLCLSLPHLSGNLSLDCPSFSPFPMSICRVGLCPLQCADTSPVAQTSEGSAEAPAPDFRHVCELMTWVKGSALTLNFLAFDFSSHSLTFL